MRKVIILLLVVGLMTSVIFRPASAGDVVPVPAETQTKSEPLAETTLLSETETAPQMETDLQTGSEGQTETALQTESETVIETEAETVGETASEPGAGKDPAAPETQTGEEETADDTETVQETDVIPETASESESVSDEDGSSPDDQYHSGDVYDMVSDAAPRNGRMLMASSSEAVMHYYFYLVNHDFGKIFEDGRDLNHVGMIMLKFGGKWHVAYCVHHNANILNGDEYYTGGSWKSKRYHNGVGRALYFGLNKLSYTYTGTDADKNRPGSKEGAKYVATQTAIWLMEKGWFWDDPSKADKVAEKICSWTRDNNNGKAGTDKAMGDYAWSYYQQLRDQILADEKMPSFTSATAAEAGRSVRKMNYADGSYKLVLQDSNDVYGSCSVSGLPSGVNASYSGGALTLTTSKPFSTATVTVTKSVPVYENAAVLWRQHDASRQNVATYTVPETNDEKAYFSIAAEQVSGQLKLQKTSGSPEITDRQPAYSLKGAVYDVFSDSSLKNLSGKLTTDDKGTSNVLSLAPGTYWVKEETAPAGYQKDTRTYEAVVKTGELTMVGDGGIVRDQPATGSFRLTKRDADTGKTMSGVTFQITCTATGKTENITTDGNGCYDGAADSKMKALPIGNYTYSELRGNANFGKTLATGSFTVQGGTTTTVDVSDMNYIFGTLAADQDGKSHELKAVSGTKLTDTVSYRGLTAGKEYRLCGTLMDAASGKAVTGKDGKAITAETLFRPDQSSGEAKVIFSFDASAFSGKTFVVFEALSLDGEVIARHEDLKDAGQTIYFPGIRTRAADAVTKTSHASEGKEVHLTDTVIYNNLRAGKTYEVSGVLMDKNSGKPVTDAAGKQVTAKRTFTPQKTDGSVTLDFAFDGSGFAGREIVAFETLIQDGRELAVHADLEDEGQTVRFPEIRTSAADVVTGTQHAMASKEVHLTDTVKYVHLIPGKTYMVSGQLMDRETGEAVTDAAGEAVTAETEFSPESSHGSISLEFVFDGRMMAGRETVVFETLYYGEHKLAVHADLDDEGQTVRFPEIRTNVMDDATGTRHAMAAKEVHLTDTVSYRHLLPGKTYSVSGQLMDKKTGEAVTDASGEVITAQNEFTAEEADGTVEMTFVFDGSLLAGRETVVFETLYYEEKQLAVHADLEDEEQTVRFPDIKTNAADEVTGTRHAMAAKEIHLTDMVSYTHLMPGKTYAVSGKLMDKVSGEPVKDATGKTVEAQAEFTAEEADGSIVLDFVFDGSLMAGRETVVFETLYYEEKQLAVHADLEDEDQTVRFPEIRTNAADGETGSDRVCASETVTLKDSVVYRHLIPGKTYKITGQLMDKKTGEAVLDAVGEAVTAENEFTPDGPDGSVEVMFEFDGSLMAGRETVVFETLYYEGYELAVHADLEDLAQTIIFPQIHTSAADRKTGTHEGTADHVSEIIDTVDYTGLQEGERYIISGMLMDKKTGRPVKNSGRAVTGKTEFTADSESGSVQVSFKFDASGNGDVSTVVFERLYQGENVLAVHEDLKDEGQMVTYHQPPVIPETDQAKVTPGTGDGFSLFPAIATLFCGAATIGAMAFVYLRKGGKRF